MKKKIAEDESKQKISVILTCHTHPWHYLSSLTLAPKCFSLLLETTVLVTKIEEDSLFS